MNALCDRCGKAPVIADSRCAECWLAERRDTAVIEREPVPA